MPMKATKKAKPEPKFPMIDFCFQGWVRDAEIKRVLVVKTCKWLDTTGMKVEKLLKGLRSGKYALDFTEVYSDTSDTECEIFDYDEGSDNEWCGTGGDDN
jgi:hypothetical protein